jgi:hypothetical protein
LITIINDFGFPDRPPDPGIDLAVDGAVLGEDVVFEAVVRLVTRQAVRVHLHARPCFMGVRRVQ